MNHLTKRVVYGVVVKNIFYESINVLIMFSFIHYRHSL